MQSRSLDSALGCYQCQKCSSGCPVASFMEIKPHQMVQMAARGMEDELLRCSAVWLCLSCYTCTTRCPNEVDVAGIIDSFRSTAIRRKIVTPEPSAVRFHDAFLKNIKTWGRTHELSVMVLYKWGTRRYLEDMRFGLKMFLKGKIRLMPALFKGRRDVRLMFSADRLRELSK
jgi:heterodisulfide reductase subunit C2